MAAPPVHEPRDGPAVEGAAVAGSAADRPGGGAPAPARPRRGLRLALRVAAALVVIGLAAYFLTPKILKAGDEAATLGKVHPGWLSAGLVGVAISLVAFSFVTRNMLHTQGSPLPFGRILRIDLTTVAVSHAVPGGTAVGTALGIRMLHGSGVEPRVAAFVKVAQGLLSQVILQLLLWLSVAIAIPLNGTSPLYISATIVGGVITIVVTLLVVLIWRADDSVRVHVGRMARFVPKVTGEQLVAVLVTVSEEMRIAVSDRRRAVSTLWWSAANWIFDAAALWFCVRGLGFSLSYLGVMVTFALASVLASIPITPSGLGIVEGVMVPTLIAFDCPLAAAVWGTMAWRFVNFWLPLPVGLVAYLTIPAGERRPAPARTREEELAGTT